MYLEAIYIIYIYIYVCDACCAQVACATAIGSCAALLSWRRPIAEDLCMYVCVYVRMRMRIRMRICICVCAHTCQHTGRCVEFDNFHTQLGTGTVF